MFLTLVENTVRLYLCDTKDAALHQIVLNTYEKELSPKDWRFTNIQNKNRT